MEGAIFLGPLRTRYRKAQTIDPIRKLTPEELESIQPEITKLMKGLEVSEKVIILKKCIEELKHTHK